MEFELSWGDPVGAQPSLFSERRGMTRVARLPHFCPCLACPSADLFNTALAALTQRFQFPLISLSVFHGTPHLLMSYIMNYCRVSGLPFIERELHESIDTLPFCLMLCPRHLEQRCHRVGTHCRKVEGEGTRGACQR